jgi:hypothetical protein
MIISEYVQCPCCGEKDYLESDIGSCLQCGYDGSMTNEWIYLIVWEWNTLTVELSDLAKSDGNFWYELFPNGNIFTDTEHFDFFSTEIITVTIYHDNMKPPTNIGVAIDNGNYEIFQINQEQTIELSPLTMNTSHIVHIKVQWELPPS